MKCLFCPLLSAFLTTAALADSKPCQNGRNFFQCVKFVRNYDADTITFEIGGVHPLLGHNIPIRVKGVDAPELRTANACEKAQGLKAKDFVKTTITAAKSIELNHCQRGKYFRLVCDVFLDGISLAKLLIDQNFAYPYDGGTKSEIDWCKQN